MGINKYKACLSSSSNIKVGESLSESKNLTCAPLICFAISNRYLELNPISNLSPV